jgi:hypothetical protein
MKIALCLFGYTNSKETNTTYCALTNNFKHLFEQVMVHNPDVFIHSWEYEKDKQLIDIFEPKYYTFEKQKKFTKSLNKIDWNRFSKSYQKPFNSFSALYSVKQSNDLKIIFEKENNFKYDCVISSRFDVGYHNSGKNKTSFINFDKNNNMNCVYTAFWDQLNAGPSNHWIYSNSKNMDLICNMYDYLVEYLNPNSEYIKEMTSGMFDTNEDDWFSNEFLKNIKTKKYHKYTEDYCLNNHTLLKWHLYKNNLWNKDICKFLNEESWSRY